VSGLTGWDRGGQGKEGAVVHALRILFRPGGGSFHGSLPTAGSLTAVLHCANLLSA
jgi:hypothetical protein